MTAQVFTDERQQRADARTRESTQVEVGKQVETKVKTEVESQLKTDLTKSCDGLSKHVASRTEGVHHVAQAAEQAIERVTQDENIKLPPHEKARIVAWLKHTATGVSASLEAESQRQQQAEANKPDSQVPQSAAAKVKTGQRTAGAQPSLAAQALGMGEALDQEQPQAQALAAVRPQARELGVASPERDPQGLAQPIPVYGPRPQAQIQPLDPLVQAQLDRDVEQSVRQAWEKLASLYTRTDPAQEAAPTLSAQTRHATQLTQTAPAFNEPGSWMEKSGPLFERLERLAAARRAA